MMKRGLLVAWFWFFGISVFAQEDPVLMRVNGKDILRSEFEYSYRHRTGMQMQNSLRRNMRNFSLNRN